MAAACSCDLWNRAWHYGISQDLDCVFLLNLLENSALDSGKEVGAPAVRTRGLPQGVGDFSSISPLIVGLPIRRLWTHSDVASSRQHQEWVMAPWPEKQEGECRDYLQQRQCQLPGCRSCLPGAGGWEEPSHSHHHQAPGQGFNWIVAAPCLSELPLVSCWLSCAQGWW